MTKGRDWRWHWYNPLAAAVTTVDISSPVGQKNFLFVVVKQMIRKRKEIIRCPSVKDNFLFFVVEQIIIFLKMQKRKEIEIIRWPVR